MKRCPKCNRTYTIETQRFCTHDGEPLVDFESARAETIRIDSQSPADAPTKTISRELPAEPFDPYKTVVERPPQSTISAPRTPEDPYKTVVERPQATIPPSRVTGDLPAHPSAPLTGSENRTSTPLPTSASLPAMPSTPVPQPSPPPTQTSAPLPASMPAAQTSGALPAAGSGPISSPAPPAMSQPYPARTVAPARRVKKSKAPLVLGILAVLLILGIGIVAVAYLTVVRPILARRSVTPTPAETPRRRIAEPTPIAEEAPPNQSAAGPEQAPFVAPPNSIEFANSKDDLDGKLAEHYVDFSFYYPKDWKKDETAGVPGAKSFARVVRELSPDFPQEIFSVGWYASTGSDIANRASYPRLVEERSSQFARQYSEYRKVSEGETRVGVYQGYEFRFESLSRDTAKGDINVWGRVIFVPPPDGGKNGVTLLMLATSLAPELNSIDDVGEKGELPIILNTFRFGKK